MCRTSCSASRDVPYLLQCLKKCFVPPAVPQEVCSTSCSASRDVSYLLQCLKRCAVPPAVPQDVSYLLQCLKRCVVPPAVPQEVCRTSCSASRDMLYLLQCRVVPRDTSLRSVPTSLTANAFRVFQSIDIVDHLVVLRCDHQSFCFAEQLYKADPNIRRLLVRIMRLTVMQCCCLSPFTCSLQWPSSEGRLQPWCAADLGQCNSRQLGRLLARVRLLVLVKILWEIVRLFVTRSNYIYQTASSCLSRQVSRWMAAWRRYNL